MARSADEQVASIYAEAMTSFAKVLVSDFDGTMARHDFYKLVLESLLSPGTPVYWGDYHAGRITHGRRGIAECRLGRRRHVRWVRSVHRSSVEIRGRGDRGLFEPRSIHRRPGTADGDAPDQRFRSPTLGVNKAAVVRHYLAEGRTVAFAGDSHPDVDPARLVNGDLRFARSDLADVLRREGLAFHTFDRWSKIAANLVEKGV